MGSARDIKKGWNSLFYARAADGEYDNGKSPRLIGSQGWEAVEKLRIKSILG